MPRCPERVGLSSEAEEADVACTRPGREVTVPLAGRDRGVPEPPLHHTTDPDVAAIAERIFRKISKKVDALSDSHSEALAADEPLLATLSGASVAYVGATGIRRGARPARIGSGISPNRTERTGRLCVVVEGFSLHAAVPPGSPAEK